MTNGNKEAPLYGAATDKCRFCGKAIRKDEDCWENAEGGSEEGTLSCEKNPDEAKYEAEEEVAPHEPVGVTLAPLGQHDWVPMLGRFKRVKSCAKCGMRKEAMPGSRGGYTRFVYQNGSCHDSVTIDEPSCSGVPADWALRGAE